MLWEVLGGKHLEGGAPGDGSWDSSPGNETVKYWPTRGLAPQRRAQMSAAPALARDLLMLRPWHSPLWNCTSRPLTPHQIGTPLRLFRILKRMTPNRD